jgi:hypothetical protein
LRGPHSDSHSDYPNEGGKLLLNFPTALFGASELAPLFELICMTSHSVSFSKVLSRLKQSSAAVGFPQRVMEKGAGLAISPLAGTPNRLVFPGSGDALF